MPTRVRSFCKINLGLAVGPVRPDGFHELTTAYQTLTLYDFVTVTATPAATIQITLEANHPAVPCTAAGNCDRNTAYKMVAGALGRMGIGAEVHIAIEKRLPVQGGLGAGSANAVAALLGLERELKQALPGPERLALAAEVGSDVPLFLIGGAVLGLHRGESVFPLPDARALPVVVAVPDVGVSTAQAFRDLDAQMDLDAQESADESNASGLSLTPRPPADRLKELSRVLSSAWTPTGAGRVTTGITEASSQNEDLLHGRDASESLHSRYGDLAEEPLLALVRTGVENDFESVAFRQHPSLRVIKHALLGEESKTSVAGASRALYAALSGSGSALFGVYLTTGAAREAQQRVQQLGTRALLTETLPRSEYWRRMFA